MNRTATAALLALTLLVAACSEQGRTVGADAAPQIGRAHV